VPSTSEALHVIAGHALHHEETRLGGRMKAGKSAVETIDQYIGAQRESVREPLKELRETIREAAPEASEKIAYGMPTFHHCGNLVHFAAFKNHIGFYPTPSGIEAFKEELQPYKRAKGSVQFPLTEPLPLDIVVRMVKCRVLENTRKSRMKG
jgi:uncharacterized protein YdhG (YjbR/CyaY superfamily)